MRMSLLPDGNCASVFVVKILLTATFKCFGFPSETERKTEKTVVYCIHQFGVMTTPLTHQDTLMCNEFQCTFGNAVAKAQTLEERN